MSEEGPAPKLTGCNLTWEQAPLTSMELTPEETGIGEQSLRPSIRGLIPGIPGEEDNDLQWLLFCGGKCGQCTDT